jgi:hypothetical protein
LGERTVRLSWIAIAATLLAPAEAFASSCPRGPEPTVGKLTTPAGVAEYRDAASVAVVSLKPTAQPPCFWIKFGRWIKPGAYPHDVCAGSMRSERHEMTVVEVLKGDPPTRSPAIFNGRYPADVQWVMRNRPDARFAQVWPSQLLSPDEDWMVGHAKGHSSTVFRHAGRISDLTLVVDYGLCKDDTIPFLTPYNGALKYVVFSDAGGRAIHWEPVETRRPDVLLERLRALKAGRDVRETIAAKAFFASMWIASQYEVKWCATNGRLRPVGGQRNGKLDTVADWAWSGGEAPGCAAGQRYLAIGTATLSRRWSDEREWPSIQLLPITNGAIRTADIVTQMKIEGPETIPVAQALAWTD